MWPFNLVKPAQRAAHNYEIGKSVSPYQQLMAEQYLSQNPGADFSGIPGYDLLQQRYERKVKSQKPFSSGQKAEGKKESGGKNPDTALMPASGVQMGAKGFEEAETPGRSRKDFIFNKIQEKKNAGLPLSQTEQKFEKKYLGISDSTKGPQTTEDRIRIRKLAADMAKSDAIQEIGPEAAAGYEPSEEQISNYVLDAAQYLYPKMEIDDASTLTSMISGGEDASMGPDLPNEAADGLSKVKTKEGKTVDLDIQLPSNIKKASQAVEFLTKQGLSEDQAKEWLRARMR